MKYVAREQIKRLFNNPQEAMINGLYFSGYEGEGEYKEWWINGQLYRHCFYKNGEKDGDSKVWQEDGKIYFHRLYRDGKVIKEYMRADK